MDSKERILSLDGLRALSILLVIASHASCARGFPGASKFAASSIPYYVGNLGVRIFFVISGFLITRLLLKEEEKSGSISLSAFFQRRVFRIAPVFFTYILIIALLDVLGVLDVPWKSLLIAGTFTADVFRPDWYLGHFWSLSVEEQFYLLWPFLVYWLPLRRRWQVAIAAFVLAATVGAFLSSVGSAQAAEGVSSFATIAMGCLLALARSSEDDRGFYKLLTSPFTVVGCLLLAISAMFMPRGVRLELLTISMSILIASAVGYLTQRQAVGSSILNWGPIAYIGRLSYSLYIWQELFLRIGDFDHGLRFPVNIGAVVVTAMCSYYLVEQPSIRLRQGFSARSRKAHSIKLAPLDAESRL